MKIAVIGAGIAGIGAALELSKAHRVTLFEASTTAGGHANAVDVTLDDLTHPVDTGFLVLNERTYPQLLSLFKQLEVTLAASDMSFSASLRPNGVEWSGTNLATLFAQPKNLLSGRFLRMLFDIGRFNRLATKMAEADSDLAKQPLDQWLDQHHFGPGFRQWYLLPMAAAIWSCPTSTMQQFPIGSFVRFFHNHGLLQVTDRPQWFTVKGSSRHYVDSALSRLEDVRLNTPVRQINRQQTSCVQVKTDGGSESFDAVVMACHSTQSLALLDEPGMVERNALSAIQYQPNKAWLHTDAALMPVSKRAWSAWNYLARERVVDATNPTDRKDQSAVSVTYWLNKLQPLPFRTPLFISLNPIDSPAPEKVIQTFSYEHPVFNQQAIDAQATINTIQGNQRTWYCGAWMGYGFHEDGLQSGLEAAQHLLSQPAATDLGRAGQAQLAA